MATCSFLIFFLLTTLLVSQNSAAIAEEQYENPTPPSSAVDLSANLNHSCLTKDCSEDAKKFLFYSNQMKPMYDHDKAPPSFQRLNHPCLTKYCTEEAKKFLFYSNQMKPKYDHHKKDGYHLPSDLSILPINFFKYNWVTNGTRMISMFRKQGKSSLFPKTDPKWSNESWSSDSDCGMSTVKGEMRGCVDSKESMVKFVTSIMGNKVKTLSTPPGKLQLYSVVGPVRTTHSRVSTCHCKGEVNLPYAVYSCHYIPKSRVRVVPLRGADGTRLDALVVCHMDTSSWDPLGFVIKLLNTKPGGPICHFMATDDLLWVN